MSPTHYTSDEAAHLRPLRFHFERADASRLLRTHKNDFLMGTYEVTCNGKTCLAAWNPKERKRLQEVLENFSRGELTAEEFKWLSPVLHKFLGGRKGGLEKTIRDALMNGADSIELSANISTSSLLTNVPWEIAAMRSNGSELGAATSLEDLFATLPVTRSIPGKKVKALADSRLRLLYCISNPDYWNVRRFNANAFKEDLDLTLRQFPMLEVKASGMNMDHPAKSRVLAEINGFKPHIFIFIGHGDSSEKTSTQPQLLFEKWTNFAEIAYPLIAKESTLLVILICCDMTRKNEEIGGWSGAYRLTQRGIPAVVAMQGNVQTDFAKIFMENLLANLLVCQPVPDAVSISRRLNGHKISKLQTFLPAVFSNQRSPVEPIRRALEEYRDKLAELSHRIPKPSEYLGRPGLEKQLKEAFRTNGVLIVTGGRGCGKSALLAQVVEQLVQEQGEAPARPIFYHSCDEPGVSSDTPFQVFGPITKLMGQFKELLSEKKVRIRHENPQLFFVRLDRKKVVIVVDNFNIPSHQENFELWFNTLKAAVGGIKESLLIIVMDVIPPTLNIPVIRVEPFSSMEISEYLKKFLPSCLPMAQSIEKEIGGLPLFMNALQLKAQDSPGECDLAFLKGLSSSSITDDYLRSIQGLLSPSDLQTFYNLCWLPRPTTIQLAVQFLDASNGHGSLSILQRVGLLRESTRGTFKYCYVPSAISGAANRLNMDEIARAADTITARFQKYMPKEKAARSGFVKSIATQCGGLALLECVQKAYAAKSLLRQAAAITVLADQANMERAPLLRLYKLLLPNLPDNQEFPFRLRAAELAQGLGRLRECGHILETIPTASLTPFYHVKYLKIRAAFLKDTKQHAGIPEILRLYEEAISLANEGVKGALTDADALSQDWLKLLRDLLHDRLMVRAFLQHAPMKVIMADLNELKQLLGESPEFANELCLVAEYELKGTDGIDWVGVGDRLLKALHLLRNKGYDRYLAQCLYFYGEYLRRRQPDPKPKYAARIYHKAGEAAAGVGDFRRLGRATRRWVDIEWRTLKTLKPVEACAALENVVPHLANQWEDALGMRVLERLYTLRAEIGKDLPADPTREFLMLACQAADQPVLQAASDNTRFGRALRRYLGEFRRADDFPEAQQLLYDYQNSVRKRLKLEPEVKDPWVFLTVLQEKYPDEQEA